MRFKLVILVLAVSLFGFIHKNNPSGKKMALLVSELDPRASSNKLQHLVKYIFSEGTFVGKEELLAVPLQKEGVKGSYVRFDLGENKLYKNRYIVTGIGNIIDAQTKKLLLTEKDQFVKFNGDSVVFFTNDIFKGKYYSVFNLKTETYSKVNDLLYKAIPGKDIEFAPIGKLFQIWLYDISGKKKVLVNDAGETDALEKKQKSPPVIWLDNDNFLYAKLSLTRNTAEIMQVDCDFAKEEKICEITAIPRHNYASSFYRNTDNTIIYSCAAGNYTIDVKKKKCTKNVFESVGGGFAVESQENSAYGRKIQFLSTEIGKYWTDYSKTKTAVGHLAASFDIVVGTERFPQGVAVWNALSKKWQELDAADGATVIGWVEE